jgi:hypothetical protein
MRVPGAALLLAAVGCAGRPRDAAPSRDEFAGAVAALSEPGGYFDTDNLISNESSYLHALGPLERLGLRGGAYIGVGPDQNFSYITHLRPSVAFVLDIRRDNLLEHLLFKALFALADTRVEYLALLFGRPPPHHPAAWTSQGVDSLVAWLDATPPDSAAAGRARRLVDSTVKTFGLRLSTQDQSTIARFHATFIAAGLNLQFETFGRGSAWYYPTYRALLTERDGGGRQASFLATESGYAFLRDLQARNLVIPVVGDFAGGHALAAIAGFLRRRGETVTAFYTSNVEYYLFREGGFARFAANVARLPRSADAVMIRSLFLRSFGGGHPQAVPGYPSVQLVQDMDRFIEGEFPRYRDLVADYIQ